MATHDAPTEDRPSGAYADAHARSLRDPEGFWLDAARAIDWTVAPTRALDAPRPCTAGSRTAS